VQGQGRRGRPDGGLKDAVRHRGYELTDCGNAERLVELYGEGIRFCRLMREWFVWRKPAWTVDSGAVVQLAKKAVRTMNLDRRALLDQAEELSDSGEILRLQADALSKWARRSEGARHIAAMVHLAESDPRVCISPGDFDRDPWALNVLNGTIDLRTGYLRPHKPEDLTTKLAPVAYDPRAKCERWLQFLEEVFKPHPEVINFLQRAIGYTLTGDVREECIFILVGKGRNGKSTLIKILHDLLGSYGGVAEIETFLMSHRGALREDIADMQGRRFIGAQEPALEGAFAEGKLKWLSGGDMLRSRRLWEHAQEFAPSHKLWLAVNKLPKLRHDDPAAWSRLRLIPFDVSFENMPDRELKRKLRDELNGILNWALQGCLLWQQTGLGFAPSMKNVIHLCRKAINI